MTDPINLNKIRKDRARANDKARADANAVKFGRTKAERLLTATRDQLTAARLSQHKFDDDGDV